MPRLVLYPRYFFKGFFDCFVDFCFSCLVLLYFPLQLPVFVVWEGQVTNMLTQKIVCFNSWDELQSPVNKLSLLVIQVGETFLHRCKFPVDRFCQG